ncbi:MAG: hypothetical protein VKI42_00720 [Synechococcaceae cyanobacterium]|nr:hypothetical protein [Synechococcaceae cyanobacterium]
MILATNLPANLDEAFSPLAQLEVDLEALAERHELSAGLILNVVRLVGLRAIRQELEKEGKGV